MKVPLLLRSVLLFSFYWLMGSPVHAGEVAVPVHALPHQCRVHGFPQVMDTGILGCIKSGGPGLWMSLHTSQTEELPVGQWAKGTALFQPGVHGGVWDLVAWDWLEPKVRVVSEVAEGQIYASAAVVVWAKSDSIHRLDVSSRLHSQIEANPLTGTHPVPYADQVAWMEWGEHMGVHLWSPSTGVRTHLPSPHPSSLTVHQDQLAWVSEEGIVTWDATQGQRSFRKGRIQDVFSTERGLCWTQWLDDMDILCEDKWHFQRSGHQNNPVWKGDRLYFTEDEKLWMLKASGE